MSCLYGGGVPEQQLPPVVYAPTLVDDAGADRIRMHEMSDGRIGLFVYSAIDRLAAQYGDDATWVLMTPAHLDAAYSASPFDMLFLDRDLYPGGDQE